jgi:3'(2'), 5'-bisphosphate nucleotidase
MPHDLETAKMLSIRAGAILLEHFARPDIAWKGQGNPVTEADRLASAFLVKELRRMFPEDGILSEEEHDDIGRLSRSRVWIIDPLDGTMEFINHLNEFAVMIGLSVNGVTTLGVIYQPVTQKLYYAESGSGAFVVENRTTRLLNVSPESNPAAMTIAVSRSHHSVNVDRLAQRLGIESSVCFGSLGLKAGLICEGQAHLYVNTSDRTSQWDTCAADVILREAGGCTTDLSNSLLRYNVPEVRNLRGVIASNGTIHQEIVRAVQAVCQKDRDEAARH